MSELDALKSECLSCKRCDIGQVMVDGSYLSNVFSNMNSGVDVMVVGQNPGREEVEKKEPFVGASGKFFDEVIADVLGITRGALYISNTIRCFTPGNRTPYQSEIDNCRYFLDREIAIVKPKVIVSLGAPAFKQLTGMGGITKHHGEVIVSLRYRVPVLPLFHPSPYNMNDPVKREMFRSALAKLKEVLDAGDEMGRAESE